MLLFAIQVVAALCFTSFNRTKMLSRQTSTLLLLAKQTQQPASATSMSHNRVLAHKSIFNSHSKNHCSIENSASCSRTLCFLVFPYFSDHPTPFSWRNLLYGSVSRPKRRHWPRSKTMPKSSPSPEKRGDPFLRLWVKTRKNLLKTNKHIPYLVFLHVDTVFFNDDLKLKAL